MSAPGVSGEMAGPRLPVLHMGPDWLAVHKPSGLHTHPSALSPGEDSAARWLGQQLGQRVRAVHRLDRGASGLLLFALTSEAAGRLILAFRERRVGKRYLCLVRGWPEGGEGEIDRPLRDLDPQRAEPVLQEARTSWRTLAAVEAPFPSGSGGHAFPTTRISLLECVPHTGRMHQIRRHLAGIGHPLLGDGEHGSRPLNRLLAIHISLSRLALCCVELELDAQAAGAAACTLRSRLDPDLARVLARLGMEDPTAGQSVPPLFDGVIEKPGKGWRTRAGRPERRGDRRAELATGTARPIGVGRLDPDPADGGAACALCGGRAGSFHREGGRHWRSCPECGLVQEDPATRATPEARAERLRLHRNDPADEGYRAWLAPLASALATRLPRGARGFDLGCGPAQVLVELLNQAGLEARGWDPLFGPMAAPESPQDWLCACEVFEHLEDPLATCVQWDRWLAPGGWLALSTALLEDDHGFPGWSYARDRAHLAIARPSTLDWLARRFGWRLEREGRVILFHKETPCTVTR